jgi:DNA ligase (NAD+)
MAKTTTIAGNTFLFTGKLNEFKREDAEAHVKAEGGKVLSGVSAKLNYLVVGEDAGSKLAKAEALGTVTILHEKEFLKMMNSGS